MSVKKKRILGAGLALALCGSVVCISAFSAKVEETPTADKSAAAQSVLSEAAGSSLPAGVTHVVVLDMDQLEDLMTLGGLEVPAHTAVYFAQANIISSIEMSVDCASPLYYGAAKQVGIEGAHWGGRVIDGSSCTEICPDVPGECFLYLANAADETAVADVVVLTQETAQANARSTAEEVRVHPIMDANLRKSEY
jgi:hypothetical protein